MAARNIKHVIWSKLDTQTFLYLKSIKKNNVGNTKINHPPNHHKQVVYAVSKRMVNGIVLHPLIIHQSSINHPFIIIINHH